MIVNPSRGTSPTSPPLIPVAGPVAVPGHLRLSVETTTGDSSTRAPGRCKRRSRRRNPSAASPHTVQPGAIVARGVEQRAVWSGCYRPKRRSLARARLSRLLGIDKVSPPFSSRHRAWHRRDRLPRSARAGLLARPQAALPPAFRERTQGTVRGAGGKGIRRPHFLAAEWEGPGAAPCRSVHFRVTVGMRGCAVCRGVKSPVVQPCPRRHAGGAYPPGTSTG